MMFNIYILKIIYFYILLLTVYSCTSKNEKSNANHTLPVAQEDSSPKIKKNPLNSNEIPLDTITAFYSNEEELNICIYKFLNDCDLNKNYVAKLKVIDKKGNTLFISNDNTLKKFYEGPEDDWYKITPIYKIINSNTLQIELNFLIEENPDKKTELDVTRDITKYLTGNTSLLWHSDFPLKINSKNKFAHKYITYQFIYDNLSFKIETNINYSYPQRTISDIDSIKNYVDSITLSNKLYGDYISPVINEIIILNLNDCQELNYFLKKDNGLYTDVIYYYLSFLDQK